jgi:hypothetical protein
LLLTQVIDSIRVFRILHPVRRETLFIELLENINPLEAKILLAVKDKKLPFKGLTAKLVEEAFPGLL